MNPANKLRIVLLIATIAWQSALRALASDGSPTAHSDIDVVILGDSNTWIGGDNCDKPQGWNYWWRNAFEPRSCRSYARSGATWTNTATTRRNLSEDIAILGPNNVIYNQVCRLIAAADSATQPDPQLIIIAAGTNDAWFARKRPGLWADNPRSLNPSNMETQRPSQATSLARSVMLSCALLRNRFPHAKIVLLTPLQTTATSEANITRVGDMIEQCGNALDLPVIRLDRDGGIVAADEKKAPRLTTDGTHTSIEGARTVAAILLERISAIINNN